MKLFEQESSAAMNMNIGRAILANIALEALRLEHSLPASIMFVSDSDCAERSSVRAGKRRRK